MVILKSFDIRMLCLIVVLICQLVEGQYYGSVDNYENKTVTWCTVSKPEQNKCIAFSQAVERERKFFEQHYIQLKCRQAFNKEECMTLLDNDIAQLTTLDPGEVFVGGRYHSLLPISQEVYSDGLNYQYAVAVIKKNSLNDVNSIHNLRGKKACFAGVGMLAGWITPIHTLMKEGALEIIDCNNQVKSAGKFFGPSCAVNSLIDRYNPSGDNSDKLCKLCIGEIPGGRCTNSDPYSGYEGAFRCLAENAGEISFLVHTTVQEMTSTNYDLNSIKKEQFELLCRDGTRKNIDEYKYCNWGNVPSRAIVVSSATDVNIRKIYQKFLQKTVDILGKNTNFGINSTNDDKINNYDNNNYYNQQNNEKDLLYDNKKSYDPNLPESSNGNIYNSWGSLNKNYNSSYYNRDGYGSSNNDDSQNNPPSVLPLEVFNLFESSPRYGLQHNLLFSDSARGFISLAEKDQTYSYYLGNNIENSILGVRQCPVNKMTLCVTSEPEQEKCIKMKTALKAQLLKPELICYKGHSQMHCMQAIKNGQADITVLDASDVYTAGLRFDLIPFISEVYNLPTPEYYVVVVAKESDPTTDITFLKNKNTCHPGIYTAAGWVYPMAYLLSNGWMRGYGCDSIRAAAEYFSKSCVPGALSTEYNTRVPYNNMCDLCHGVSYRYCRRDASEDYFGYTGAFRCLVEGGGDVAFVKHTTVSENTDGKRREYWARNTFTKDFELLCPDGTRMPSTDYHKCNLGKVKANAIVTRGGEYGYNETQINAYINLLMYAQQFYGRKEADEFSFSMFESPRPFSDLIFQDATQQLIIIPKEMREFSKWLGPDFMRARRVVDCNAGAAEIKFSLFASISTMIFAFYFSR